MSIYKTFFTNNLHFLVISSCLSHMPRNPFTSRLLSLLDHSKKKKNIFKVDFQKDECFYVFIDFCDHSKIFLNGNTKLNYWHLHIF